MRFLKLLKALKEETKTKAFFAHKRKDFLDAFHLLYRRYYKLGFIPQNEREIFFTPYQALPESRVCLARGKGSEIVSTTSIIIDSSLGLPSDLTFSHELDKLRKEKKKLAEIANMASKNSSVFPWSLLKVWRLLLLYALKQKVTHIVISIRPEHKMFYEKFLCFKPVSKPKIYQKYYNVPVILEILDLKILQEKVAFLGSKSPEIDIFKPSLGDILELSKVKNMSSEDFWFFFMEDQPIFYNLPEKFQYVFAIHYDLILSNSLKAA